MKSDPEGEKYGWDGWESGLDGGKALPRATVSDVGGEGRRVGPANNWSED